MEKAAIIDLAEKLSQFSDLWSPKIVAQLHDSYIKLAKVQGEYVWHKHDNEDELFLVLSGTLKIELPNEVLELKPGQLTIIPRGVMHRPIAESEAHIMLIEPKSTVSTGDAQDTQNKKITSGEWI